MSKALVRSIVLSLVLVSSASAQAPTERNREVIKHFYTLVNDGQWREAALLFAPDVRHHLGNWHALGDQEAVMNGRDVLTGNLEDLQLTFPDRRMEIVAMVAEDDTVVVRVRWSGTHRGVSQRRLMGGLLTGVPPTGKSFVVQHMHWYVLKDGLIVDHWANRDDLGMLQQLGLLPTQPPAPATKPGG
jgi:steroid delta-isomerase-like uncharacterized protein